RAASGGEVRSRSEATRPVPETDGDRAGDEGVGHGEVYLAVAVPVSQYDAERLEPGPHRDGAGGRAEARARAGVGFRGWRKDRAQKTQRRETRGEQPQRDGPQPPKARHLAMAHNGA